MKVARNVLFSLASLKPYYPFTIPSLHSSIEIVEYTKERGHEQKCCTNENTPLVDENTSGYRFASSTAPWVIPTLHDGFYTMLLSSLYT
jgi:hypothetical protein